jgi:hypothetical protein
MWEDECHRHKTKVLMSMFRLHMCQMLIHAILPGHFCGFGPVVDFLEFTQSLINDRFNVAAGPHDAPFLFAVGDFAEAIVFKSIP